MSNSNQCCSVSVSSNEHNCDYCNKRFYKFVLCRCHFTQKQFDFTYFTDIDVKSFLYPDLTKRGVIFETFCLSIGEFLSSNFLGHFFDSVFFGKEWSYFTDDYLIVCTPVYASSATTCSDFGSSCFFYFVKFFTIEYKCTK